MVWSKFWLICQRGLSSGTFNHTWGGGVLEGCHKIPCQSVWQVWKMDKKASNALLGQLLANGSVWPIGGFWIICHHQRRTAAAIFHRSLALGVALALALLHLLPAEPQSLQQKTFEPAPARDHSFMLRTITARKVSTCFFCCLHLLGGRDYHYRYQQCFDGFYNFAHRW